ncbi:unnamed protein product [Periconia digitata]|uniref:Uncharacterized protein n=1 Tax=Periconia digitata TaxID=1303443 RepID=A0A9W4XQN2_9PLEO|nr:unnamed protein product [Periconia digitata]
MRQNSLEEKRHSRYTSAGLTTEPSNGTGIAEQTGREPGSTQQLRKRTNSWQTIGKSQALTSQGTENSPITVYKKSVESIIATPNMRPRLSNRKEDSQDLLRKLARLSSTPSPGRASKNQTHNASTAIATRGIGQSMGEKSVAAGEPSTGTNRPEESTKAPQVSQSEAESRKEPLNLPENTSREQVYTRNSARPQSSRISSQELKTEPVASTPVPTERTLLNPKTPVVTGAWVDTPRTATVLKKPTEAPSDLTKPDRMGSPRKILKKEKTEDSADEKPQVLQPEVIRPKLPDSALQSIIEKARANGQKRSSDFGDSTINSLEELIADHTITSEAEDDIPPDYQKPTGDPRNEADRGRRDEWEHLHSLDNRLQSTSISVRRASNGIGKIERQFERRLKHHEEAGAGGQTRATSNTCTCLHHGERAPEPAKRWTFWKGLKSLFYDENLKRTSKRGWGLTGLSIVLLTFLTWFIAENLACDAFCNPVYATSMKGYGVIYGAPKFPFVLPTITYRALIRPWWRPLYSLLLLPLWNYISGLDDERAAAAATRKVGAATRVGASFTTHTVAAARRVFEEDGVVGMGGDEVLR